jgi:diguanylate cyclase (GGDEF)-like protein
VTDFPKTHGESLLAVLRHSFDGIALVARNPWRFVFANRALLSWLEDSEGDPQELSFEEVFGLDWLNGSLENQLDRVWVDGNDVELAVRCQVEGNLDHPFCLRVCRVEAAPGDRLLGLVFHPEPADAVVVNAIAARRDPLTELPDRAFLLSRLATLLQGDRAADRDFAVLFIDLDNFKQINDRHGHLLGDRVLREVSQRLISCVREGDHVTRYGGDEFVVLLEQVSGREEVAPVIGRIRAVLAEPIELPEGTFILSASIGVAEAGPHHRTPEDVISEADRQMYAAKRAGA